MADKPAKASSALLQLRSVAGVLGIIITLAFLFGQLNREQDRASNPRTAGSAVATTHATSRGVQPTIVGSAPTTSACSFSEQEASCVLEPDDTNGSGWIHRAAGTDVNLRACWSPLARATHADGTPVFKKIEYLSANGTQETFDPDNPQPASAFNFYVTRRTILSLNLAQKCRPIPS